jgi:hypothetical protein
VWVDRFKGILVLNNHNLEITGNGWFNTKKENESTDLGLTENHPNPTSKKISTFTCTGNTEGGCYFYVTCHTYGLFRGSVDGGEAKFTMESSWKAKDLSGLQHQYRLDISTDENGDSTETTKTVGLKTGTTHIHTTSASGEVSSVDASAKVERETDVAVSYEKAQTVRIGHTNGKAFVRDYDMTSKGMVRLTVGQSETRERYVGGSIELQLQNKPNSDDLHEGEIKEIKWGTEVVEMRILPYMGDAVPAAPSGYISATDMDPDGEQAKRRALGDSQGSSRIPGRRAESVVTCYLDAGADGEPFEWTVSDGNGMLSVVDVQLSAMDSGFDAELSTLPGGFRVSATGAFCARVVVRANGTAGEGTFTLARTGSMPEYVGVDSASVVVSVAIDGGAYIVAGLEGWQRHEETEAPPSEFYLTVQRELSVPLNFDFGGSIEGINWSVQCESSEVEVNSEADARSVKTRVSGLAVTDTPVQLVFSALGREVIVWVTVVEPEPVEGSE